MLPAELTEYVRMQTMNSLEEVLLNATSHALKGGRLRHLLGVTTTATVKKTVQKDTIENLTTRGFAARRRTRVHPTTKGNKRRDTAQRVGT